AHPDAGTGPPSVQDQNTGHMIDYQARVGNPGRVNHANRARSSFHVPPTGVSTALGTSVYSGVGIASTGLVPVFGTSITESTHTTALARSLAWEPVQRPVGRLLSVGFLLLLPALFALAPAFAAYRTIEPESQDLAAILGILFVSGAIATPGLLVVTVAIQRARRNSKIARGRHAAYTLWRAAFYCHRCGLAFWPYSPTPGVPARQGFAPQQFRWFVWTAGGYANA
ncbi:hypothetical protein, partial [Nocardia sputi]|uniref:hypothetical protein n=1 Tax=Nocardia sputi TaxID=2943705 RepID=UPI0020BF74EA